MRDLWWYDECDRFANPGIDVFIERDIPYLKQYDTNIIVNVCGKTPDEYIDVVRRLAEEDVALLEINISCRMSKREALHLVRIRSRLRRSQHRLRQWQNSL